MLKRSIPWLLGAALLTFIPTRVLAQNCGPFADVLASDPFCPFILEAFNNGITSGTSTTTFSPGNTVTRNQMVVFFDKGVDITLHRGTNRTAIGKTWVPTATNGGIATDEGGALLDIVSDGQNLWMGRNDGKILKVNAADRRLSETWTLTAGIPLKLGIFAGQVFIADDQGHLTSFNPTNTAGSIPPEFSSAAIAPGFPALAYDGTSVWQGTSQTATIRIFPVVGNTAFLFTFPANVDGMVFDGQFMWVLLANSTIQKMQPNGGTPTLVETLALPSGVTDCRMVYDGANIWIPIGNGILYVVHPTTTSPTVLPSSIILNTVVPNVGFPYVASFDGENIMIGGVNNGTVALVKATTLTLLGTFNSGAAGVRGIASDGRTFNVGDAFGTKFFQF